MNSVVPFSEGDEFALIKEQAKILARSGIIPKAYVGKENDIIAAALLGRSKGWDTMTSLLSIYVIEGSASMKPEAMLGLVRQAGHSVTVSVEGNKAIAKGKRYDTGDTHIAEFSTRDAEVAGLLQKRNWKQYGDAMLTWRAVSILCRVLFPDVVLGVSYVPEELGIEDTNDKGELLGEVVEVDFSLPEAAPSDETVGGVLTIEEELKTLVEVDRELLKEWWKSEQLPSLSSGQMTEEEIESVLEKIEWLKGGPETA